MASIDYGRRNVSSRPERRPDPSSTRQKRPRSSLEEINVHKLDSRSKASPGRPPGYENSEGGKVPHDSRSYIYINDGYSGSVTSLSTPATSLATPTVSGVIREQYWTCSKWPRAQRILVIAVGVLAGAVIGLAITMGLRAATGQEGSGIIGPPPIFRNSVPD